MKLSLALIAAAPILASAKRLSAGTKLDNADIKATSKTGNRILSKARRLDNNDGDATWVAGYSIKFDSCVMNQNYYGGYFADNQGNYAANYEYNGAEGQNQNGQYQNGQYAANAYGDNGNGYYNNENRNDFEGMYSQKLVHFKLCPSDSCRSCKNGADYVIDLNEYVDAVMEAKMAAQEYNCERVRENCYCQNAYSEESCQYNCYKNAGFEYCAEAMVEDEFDLQEALECSQLDVDKDAVNNYYFQNRQANQQAQNGYYYGQEGQQNQQIEKLYVGPTCAANGKNIHLAVFTEETCSITAPSGIYEAVNYGQSLPYAKKGLIDSGCISCKEPKEVDYQNYWDQQDPDEVTDVCERLYEESGKCEEAETSLEPTANNSLLVVFGLTFERATKTSSRS